MLWKHASLARVFMLPTPADEVCWGRPLPRRESGGFLGLGRSCFGYLREHFESDDEIDPGLNHVQYFYAPGSAGSTHGQPATLIVRDVFLRHRFALPFNASCAVHK